MEATVSVVSSVAPVVLVFEDEAILREMMGVILTSAGVSYRAYEHPLVELFQPHDCDAPDAPCKGVNGIISDVMMPVVDGMTFYSNLFKSNCQLKNKMLVLMSAMDFRKEICTSPFVDHVHYLDKPYRVDELTKILKQHLAH